MSHTVKRPMQVGSRTIRSLKIPARRAHGPQHDGK